MEQLVKSDVSIACYDSRDRRLNWPLVIHMLILLLTVHYILIYKYFNQSIFVQNNILWPMISIAVKIFKMITYDFRAMKQELTTIFYTQYQLFVFYLNRMYYGLW